MAMFESVAMRQKGGLDFQMHYDNLCALSNTCPIHAVKARLVQNVLDLNGDRIRFVSISYVHQTLLNSFIT